VVVVVVVVVGHHLFRFHFELVAWTAQILMPYWMAWELAGGTQHAAHLMQEQCPWQLKPATNTNNYAELTELFIDKHSAVSKKQGYLLESTLNNLKRVWHVSTLFLKERKVRLCGVLLCATTKIDTLKCTKIYLPYQHIKQCSKNSLWAK